MTTRKYMGLPNRQQFYVFFLCIIYIIFCCIISALNASIPSFIKTIKQLHIKSLSQRMINKTTFVFDGAVEVLIDHNFHLWADHVELDKGNGTLLAYKTDNGPISLEANDFVILADRIFLNFIKKIGSADNISIQIDEGYLSASSAEKLNETDWCMKNMVYTPCCKEDPHWHFKAQRAVMHGGYLIKASNLVFKVGHFPIFMLPKMVFPIQGHSKSGFLIPKFSYDYDFGFGIKQEYYWYIHSHCGTTIGIDWREKRGIAFLDEFRWARSKDNFTIANWWYAIAKNSFMQKKGTVLKATAHRYWISGKDFRSIDHLFGCEKISSLARIDFGTDKRIGYTFFNSLDEVDDTFSNSLILRFPRPQNLIEMKLDNAKTNVKIFSDLTTKEKVALNALFNQQETNDRIKTNQSFKKKENDNCVTIAYLPHLEWGCALKKIAIGWKYRHDLFFDQVLYRRHETEKIYFNSQLVSEKQIIPFNKTNLLRLCYRGNIHKAFSFHGNMLKATINPNIQLRTNASSQNYFYENSIKYNVQRRNNYRFFLDYGAEWALPEMYWSNVAGNYLHYLQPSVLWEYVPFVNQNNWFYFDRRDRTYPKNEISLNLRNNITMGPVQCDVHVSQGVDFYDQKDIFYLRQGAGSGNVLPLYSEVSFGNDSTLVSFGQEYDWKKATLLQSEIQTTFFMNKFHIGMGYIFQNEQAQQVRNLLSNIPHFLTINIAIPLTKHATLLYDSQFCAERNKHYASLENIRPLLHRIRLDYNGHCWGLYVGFEQKQYRECGVDRSEKIFVFSLRFDSLGSFAKKFKGIPIIKKTD